jgi:uridylate kinase
MSDHASKRYKRVVVKLSGEALQGPSPHGLDAPTLARIAKDLATASEAGHEIAVVVGGGNFIRESRAPRPASSGRAPIPSACWRPS